MCSSEVLSLTLSLCVISDTCFLPLPHFCMTLIHPLQTITIHRSPALRDPAALHCCASRWDSLTHGLPWETRRISASELTEMKKKTCFSRMKMRCDYGEIYIVNHGLIRITHKRKCVPERIIAGSYSSHT